MQEIPSLIFRVAELLVPVFQLPAYLLFAFLYLRTELIRRLKLPSKNRAPHQSGHFSMCGRCRIVSDSGMRGSGTVDNARTIRSRMSAEPEHMGEITTIVTLDRKDDIAVAGPGST